MSYTNNEINIRQCAAASAEHFNKALERRGYHIDPAAIGVWPVDYAFEYSVSFIMRAAVDFNMATRPDDPGYMNDTLALDNINIRANAMQMEKIPKLLKKALAKWLLKK